MLNLDGGVYRDPAASARHLWKSIANFEELLKTSKNIILLGKLKNFDHANFGNDRL